MKETVFSLFFFFFYGAQCFQPLFPMSLSWPFPTTLFLLPSQDEEAGEGTGPKSSFYQNASGLVLPAGHGHLSRRERVQIFPSQTKNIAKRTLIMFVLPKYKQEVIKDFFVPKPHMV